MPKIPIFEGSERLTTQPGAAKQDIRVAGAPGRMMQQAGRAIAEVGAMFEKARDTRQLTEAETEASKNFLAVKEAAFLDNDPDNYQKYSSQLEKVKQNAGKNISNGIVRNQFSGKIGLTSLSVDSDLRGIFRKKQIDFGTAALIDGIEAKKQLYLTAGLPAQRALHKQEAFVLIDQARDSQFITAKKAATEKQEIDKDWIASQVELDIATDPVVAKQLLTKGGYKDLTRSARVDYLEIADKAIKRQEKEVEVAHEDKWLKNGTQVGIDVATGKMSTTQLLEEIRNDNINPDYGFDLYKWKTDPDTVESETDKEIWKNIAEVVVDPLKNLAEIQLAVSKAMNAKQMSATDGANFMVALQALYEKADQFKNAPRRLNMEAAMKSISEIAGVFPTTLSAEFSYRAGKELFKRVFQDNLPTEKIMEASQEIIKSTTKEINPQWANYEIDQKIKLSSGTWKVVEFKASGEPVLEKLQ